MPAAAVIPAPLAYIKVVAVKKLVVEFWTGSCGPRPSKGRSASESQDLQPPAGRGPHTEPVVSSLNRVRSGPERSGILGCLRYGMFTLRKLECSEQAVGM